MRSNGNENSNLNGKKNGNSSSNDTGDIMIPITVALAVMITARGTPIMATITGFGLASLLVALTRPFSSLTAANVQCIGIIDDGNQPATQQSNFCCRHCSPLTTYIAEQRSATRMQSSTIYCDGTYEESCKSPLGVDSVVVLAIARLPPRTALTKISMNITTETTYRIHKNTFVVVTYPSQ